jgi:hypothetical protein
MGKITRLLALECALATNWKRQAERQDPKSKEMKAKTLIWAKRQSLHGRKAMSFHAAFCLGCKVDHFEIASPQGGQRQQRVAFSG